MSEVKTDKLTGTSTAGSILVTGEGNSTTTNLQQGLTKVWINFEADGSGIPSRDSLNVSSTDDDGTGDYGINFSASFSNNDYAGGMMASMGTFSNNDVGLVGPSRHAEDASLATGSIQLDGQKSSHTDGTARDVGTGMLNLLGDLA
tara:strand:+ start:251 stop:688 length:438 start_codon:yes stop_codon:yes gene_type:complete